MTYNLDLVFAQDDVYDTIALLELIEIDIDDVLARIGHTEIEQDRDSLESRLEKLRSEEARTLKALSEAEKRLVEVESIMKGIK